MANKKIEDIETKDAEVVKPASKKSTKKDYPVKSKIIVGNKTYLKGDKISLTKRGYKSLRLTKKV